MFLFSERENLIIILLGRKDMVFEIYYVIMNHIFHGVWQKFGHFWTKNNA